MHFFIIIDLRPEIGENVTSPGNRDDEVDIEAAEGCFISTTSLTLLRNIQVWLCFRRERSPHLGIPRILRITWMKGAIAGPIPSQALTSKKGCKRGV